MYRSHFTRLLPLVLVLALLAGCAGSSKPGALTPLSAKDVNLIFVVSPDIAYQASGDMNAETGNLTSQGLQRSLLMATYLKQQVLGGKNVNRIYALQPMSHLQTSRNLPDMVALGYIQQFAMLNQIALPAKGGYGSPMFTSNSYPINVSYAPGPLPKGVADPAVACPTCQGLDFNDTAGNNEALVSLIVDIGYPGYYVFSAPWETTSALMANINKKLGANLALPATYAGPNDVYAISVTTDKKASLTTYHANLNPAATYPVLSTTVTGAACSAKPFTITAAGGSNGAEIPAGSNTNETVYLVRHAEAHPASEWDDGNFIAAGQWRALALADALRGKISPSAVYAIDPAQATNSGEWIGGLTDFSYVRPALTVEPYAIANNLPFYLVSDLELSANDSPKLTSDEFFSGGAFSDKTILLAWEHDHFPPIVAALLASYFPDGQAPSVPGWNDQDYDSIWTVTLDAQGNLTVDNSLCEGIDSAKLPAKAP